MGNGFSFPAIGNGYFPMTGNFNGDNSMANPMGMYSQNYFNQMFLNWLYKGGNTNGTFPYGNPSYDADEAALKYKKESEQRIIKEYQEEIDNVKKEEADIKAEKVKITGDKSAKEDRPEPRLSFGQGVKSVAKGLVKSVIGCFTDEKGKFSWKQTLKTVVVGAAVVGVCVATGGAATPFLVGAGVALGGVQAVQGGVKFANAKTQKEQKEALENIGEGVGYVAQSFAGRGALNFTKAAKTVKLAGEIEQIAGKAGEANSVLQEAIAALKASKGRGAKFKNALADLEILTKNKEGLVEARKLLAEANQRRKIFAGSAKKLNSFDKEKLIGKLANLSPIDDIANAEKITELTANINKAATRADLSKALAEARKVVESLNLKVGNGKYNEIEALIAQGERALKIRFIPSMPTREGVIQAGAKVAQGAGTLVRGEVPREQVFGTLVAANNVNYGLTLLEREAKQAELEQKEALKLQEQQAQIEVLDEKLAANQQQKLDYLASLAKYLNIEVETNDTVESLEGKIDKKLKANKEAEKKEAEKKEAEKKAAEKKEAEKK